MQEKFSVSHKGQELGPFTRDELIAKIKSNDLSPLDYIYVDAKSDWVPLAEFMPDVSAARSPQRPPPTSNAKTMISARPPLEPPPGATPKADATTNAPRLSNELESDAIEKTLLNNTALMALAMTEPAQEPVKKKAPLLELQSGRLSFKTETQKVKPPTDGPVEIKTDIKVGSLQLRDGVGTIELLQYTAGKVTIALRDDKNVGLGGGHTEEIIVNAAPAARMTIKGPSEATAGETSRFQVEAVDKWGNFDAHFGGVISATISGSVSGSVFGAGEGGDEVRFVNGRATFNVSTKKAEVLHVKLTDSGKTGLDLSASCQVNYIAGPAARLLVTTPGESLVAGQAVKVQVKAVDQYGNLATTCNETIKLEVSTPKKVAS